MSTASERLSIIQDNYNHALRNEPHDLAKAQTAAEITAIQENVAAARAAYYAAVAAALTESGDSIEAAFDAARLAHDAVDKARQESASLAALIQKLTGATSAVTNLLELAKEAKPG